MYLKTRNELTSDGGEVTFAPFTTPYNVFHVESRGRSRGGERILRTLKSILVGDCSMRHFRLVVAVFACLCAAVLFTLPGFAATSPNSKCSSLAFPRIINRVDDNALMSLQGNLHPLARAQYDQGKVDDSMPLEHIVLMLQRSPDQETALATRIDQMHNRRSSYYHQWLSARDVGGCYGVADADIAVVSAWLESHGFKIDTVPAGKMLIIFSGTAGQVRNTFHTEIHNLDVRGEQHIANMSEPQIPAALAPVVAGFRSLHNFFPKPLVRVVGPIQRDPDTGNWHTTKAINNAVHEISRPTGPGGIPLITLAGSPPFWAVGPKDFYTIYNENPLLTGSTAINGAGQTLAIVQETDINEADLTTFRSQFGLPAYPSTPNATQGGVNFVKGVSGYCTDPGIISDAESEADIDVQWMGTTAPAATIDFVACASTATTAGIDLSAPYIVNDLASTVSAFSVSFGWCEAELPSSAIGFGSNLFYNNLWEQAVAEGQTPVVAAGDSADDTCDRGNEAGPNGQDVGENGLSVSGLASTPYNVAAGGTDFSDAYQTNFAPTSYWNSNDTSPYLSALSYIPEMAWNGTCASPILVDYFRAYSTPIPNGAEGLCNDTSLSPSEEFTTLDGGGGGISTVYGTPTWQSAYGVGLSGNFTSISKRNLPDVSLFASNGFWNHALVFCQSDLAPCVYSNGSDASALAAGGTSFVAPMIGGIMGLINQKNPSGNAQPTRQGQANYTFYALATAEYGTPSAENTSTSKPSVYTCEGSNINAISAHSSIFSSCTFYSINRTSKVGFTACVDGTSTDCVVGNNDQPCAEGSPDCYTNPSTDTYGLLSNSTGSFEAAFSQSAGYNDATGLGSFNITNLVKNWTSVTPLFASTTTANVSQPSLYTTGTTNLTATVVATGRGSLAPPMGTVNFYSGTACTGTAFASANLVAGTGNATATASGVTGAQIGAGTTSVAACFSGDGANDAPSSQTVSGLTVTQTALTVSAPSTPVSIVGGQSGTVTLAVSANAAISTPVTFTCTGLPSDATCTFTSVASLPSSTNVTMTITTTASDAKLIRPVRGSSWLMLGFILPGFLLLSVGAATIRRSKNCLWCGLALLLMLGWLGCGGGSSGTPTPTPTPTPTSTSQTYNVTATGAATGATSGTTGTIQVTVTQ
jgi:Pro-kumamolisin, activation domain